MKKFFYSLIGLLAVVASSCSDSDSDPVVVVTESYTYGLTVSVNTAYAYGEAGSDLMDGFLSDYSSQYVGVFAFLYDGDGALAGSAQSQSRSATATQSLTISDLEDGSYTLVVIQMMVDSDYASNVWTMSGTDALSSLAITSSVVGTYYYRCLSTASKSVSISGGDGSVSVSPQLLGSIVEVGWENLDNTDYTMFGLFLDNSASGYYFDPSLSSSDKYYFINYNSDHTWNPAYLTYDTEGVEGSGTEYVYVIMPGDYTYCFGLSTTYDGSSNYNFTAYGSGEFSFEDGGYYKAYCYYVGGSSVCKTYLGSHDDFDEWYEGVSAGTVWTPCTDWGASVADVQSYMSGYEMTVGSDGMAVWDGSDYYLQYTGKSPATDIYCYFSSETGGYYTVDTYYDSSLITEEEIIEYLDENYTFYTSMDYSVIKAYYYYTEDKSTAVTYMYYYGQLIVTFSSYETIYGSYAKNPKAVVNAKSLTDERVELSHSQRMNLLKSLKR